jgi:hypothetical protein
VAVILRLVALLVFKCPSRALAEAAERRARDVTAFRGPSSAKGVGTCDPELVAGGFVSVRRVRALWVCCVMALALAGCGSSHVVIDRPARPIYASFDCYAEIHRAKGLPKQFMRVRCRSRVDVRQLLGLKLAVAERRAAQHALQVRVVERDGHDLAQDAMYLANRVDVVVSSGVVTRIAGVG